MTNASARGIGPSRLTTDTELPPHRRGDTMEHVANLRLRCAPGPYVHRTRYFTLEIIHI